MTQLRIGVIAAAVLTGLMVLTQLAAPPRSRTVARAPKPSAPPPPRARPTPEGATIH